MDIIICFLYCTAIIYGLYRIHNHNKRSEENGDIDFQHISDQIEYLSELREKLSTIEEMITDVSICSPDEHEKIISCEWINGVGDKFRYDLWVDGNDSTSEELLKIAYSERCRLRSALNAEIQKMSERCNENCNESYPVPRRGETNYE